MYAKSAEFYDALVSTKDYAAASRHLVGLARRFAPGAASLLDVGCGTGRHLEHLMRHFDVEGLDLSPGMLAVARARCPGVPLHEGSLVDFRLGRRFDVVTCLFGTIGYAGSRAGLARAAATMASHLGPGGVLMVEPWLVPERFEDGRLVLDVVDRPDLKVARMYVSRRRNRRSTYQIHYLVGTAGGVHRFTEREELGLFSRDEYVRAFEKAGLEIVLDDGDGPFGYGLVVCRARDASLPAHGGPR